MTRLSLDASHSGLTLSSSTSPRPTLKSPTSKFTRPYSRPPPILLVSSTHSIPFKSSSLISPPKSKICSSSSKSSTENLEISLLVNPVIKPTSSSDIKISKVQEWSPSSAPTHLVLSDMPSHTPRQNNFSLDFPQISRNSSLNVSHALRRSASYSLLQSPPSTPFTPLTPVPHSLPQHREKKATSCRPSIKLRTRPKPSPLQLQKSLPTTHVENEYCHKLDSVRTVRFADGSPLRGSTWHITQYPSRLASPPISADNLSLADLVELETIKQSLGTWCGEIMGSPMRSAFGQPSTNSLDSKSDERKSWTQSQFNFLSNKNLSVSPISEVDEDHQDFWGKSKWPDSPVYDSDCNSEIFEGMH
ncbi:hypothetical protein O181_101072 [Austropuccinia psidii MF-1]|uniref:Uncharacterized protein n=1 Tax=Austropuccinia psidii MF-1 TaxID=1389203 RepID=A0A9Q3JF95_9BASI|nr:hypothetical protein [Austropuccinia psidii MF-1]